MPRKHSIAFLANDPPFGVAAREGWGKLLLSLGRRIFLPPAGDYLEFERQAKAVLVPVFLSVQQARAGTRRTESVG